MYKRALISVSDKTGLEEFLKPLVNEGLQLVSTGGTKKFLESKGFKVQDVRDLTGFPEILSGRVKTLHPHLHMALLAREWVDQDQKLLSQYGIQAFDLVVGNLYPFEEKSKKHLEDKELTEWIDVGGPSFLRAAAKNYFSITTVCHPEDYFEVQKGTDLKKRKQLAAKVFKRLSHYDSMIAEKLQNPSEKERVQDIPLEGSFFKELRYGENPHQKAHWFKTSEKGLHSAEELQGKALSYNNLLDFWTALLVVRDFEEACAVAVKHNNPCGLAVADQISLATERVLKADPLSVFGALLAFNRPVDEASAKQLTNVFLEGLVAPDFSSAALDILKSKKNLRVLRWPEMLSAPLSSHSVFGLIGGFLVQTRDQVQKTWSESWRVIGASPSEQLKRDLLFAWKLCAHLKSNAIAVVKQGQSLGLGMGQVNRVDAVRLALERAKTFHPSQNRDLILASDAFFPFPDSIEWAAKGGVSWIIQPGGSVNDKKVLEKALELDLNVILTGQRHFRH